MHELYIAECILNAARRELPPNFQPCDIGEIQVRIGKLDAVVPQSLRFLFDAVKAQCDMPAAVLTIIEENIVCCCRICRSRVELHEPLFICPDCGGTDLELLSGRGMILERITLNTEAECEYPCRS